MLFASTKVSSEHKVLEEVVVELEDCRNLVLLPLPEMALDRRLPMVVLEPKEQQRRQLLATLQVVHRNWVL